MVEPNTKGWRRVKKIFGDQVINPDQTINRDKLGEIVFSDASKRRQLNKSLHGLIALEMIKQVFMHFIRGIFLISNSTSFLLSDKLKFIIIEVWLYSDINFKQ